MHWHIAGDQCFLGHPLTRPEWYISVIFVRRFGTLVPAVVVLPAATCRKSDPGIVRFHPDQHCRAARSLQFVPPPRDDRRRRLLADDLSDPDDASSCRVWSEDGSLQRKSASSGNAEFLERHWQLLDLVPRRLLVLDAVPAGGSRASSLGLEAAYAWMLGRAARPRQRR